MPQRDVTLLHAYTLYTRRDTHTVRCRERESKTPQAPEQEKEGKGGGHIHERAHTRVGTRGGNDAQTVNTRRLPKRVGERVAQQDEDGQ